MTESDPTGKQPDEPGAKLDSGKIMAGLLLDFSLALNEVAKVATYGANKYSLRGWELVPDGQERYKHAQYRHALKGQREQVDPESGILHKGHEIWNALAALELLLREAEHNHE